MALEVERKYLDADFARVRALLEQQGACCKGIHFESNDIYDTPDNAFLRGHRLLRLRRQEYADRTDYALTLKLPAQTVNGFKRREEYETAVQDGDVMHRILQGQGYVLAAHYEKFRESWRLHDVAVDMDILPFGQFIEIEGPEEAICRVAQLLDLDRQPTSTDSYHTLHSQWLTRQHKTPQRSFAFAPQEADRWRAALGLPDRKKEN
ncbi:class IV adenylate cyclase [uncultured Desulfovibrio sp.]|uniref:class IV adenylate cyclase n=1 Tax=uncultured Desulfovibrio sp. TaxID=167968 RepID=UPI00260C6110|nr:class IV adenylate cyclase [uncultured Desulfovibrio sp.]